MTTRLLATLIVSLVVARMLYIVELELRYCVLGFFVAAVVMVPVCDAAESWWCNRSSNVSIPSAARTAVRQEAARRPEIVGAAEETTLAESGEQVFTRFVSRSTNVLSGGQLTTPCSHQGGVSSRDVRPPEFRVTTTMSLTNTSDSRCVAIAALIASVCRRLARSSTVGLPSDDGTALFRNLNDGEWVRNHSSAFVATACEDELRRRPHDAVPALVLMMNKYPMTNDGKTLCDLVSIGRYRPTRTRKPIGGLCFDKRSPQQHSGGWTAVICDGEPSCSPTWTRIIGDGSSVPGEDAVGGVCYWVFESSQLSRRPQPQSSRAGGAIEATSTKKTSLSSSLERRDNSRGAQPRLRGAADPSALLEPALRQPPTTSPTEPTNTPFPTPQSATTTSSKQTPVRSAAAHDECALKQQRSSAPAASCSLPTALAATSKKSRHSDDGTRRKSVQVVDRLCKSAVPAVCGGETARATTTNARTPALADLSGRCSSSSSSSSSNSGSDIVVLQGDERSTMSDRDDSATARRGPRWERHHWRAWRWRRSARASRIAL